MSKEPKWRKSLYLFIKDNMVYNTKTNSLVRFEQKELNNFISENWDFFSDSQIKILQKEGMVIQQSFDETEEILSRLKKYEEENLSLIIFPTMSCNFNCKYCYEQKSNLVLSDDTYALLLDKIKKENFKNIKISWFGGEPSLQLEKINTFMCQLKQYTDSNGLKLSSSMTTNFYLLNAARVKELLKNGVSFFQITLDGLKETHDFYRPLHSGFGTFDVIFKNLLECYNSDMNFHIHIRTNFDNHTDYSDYIKKISFFAKDSRFSFSIHEISNWDNKKRSYVCSHTQGLEKRKLLTKIFEENKIPLHKDNKFGYFSYCYACMKNSYCIDSSGIVKKCTVHLNDSNNNLGRFSSFNNIDDISWTNMRFSECPNCNVFPICLGKTCKYENSMSFEECQLKRQKDLFFLFS